MKLFTATTGHTCRYQIEMKGCHVSSAIVWQNGVIPTPEEIAELEDYIIENELGLNRSDVDACSEFCGFGVQGRAKATEGIRQYLKEGDGEQRQ